MTDQGPARPTQARGRHRAFQVRRPGRAIGSRKPSVEGSPKAACVNCSRLGCSFHKVSGFLFKADQDKQKQFVAEYEQDKPKVEAEGWRRYFLDGVHPLYGLEVVFYCWLLAGSASRSASAGAASG
jgi:hypothetical protein